jgi:hypothetical protein
LTGRPCPHLHSNIASLGRRLRAGQRGIGGPTREAHLVTWVPASAGMTAVATGWRPTNVFPAKAGIHAKASVLIYRGGASFQVPMAILSIASRLVGISM